jgi:hypothetical protein
MKAVFWGLVWLIVIGVVLAVGGFYYLTSQPFDFKDPQKVAKFNETYVPNCVARYESILFKAGTTPTEEQRTAVNAACKCARDPLVDAFAKRPVMTIAEIGKAMDEDPEILAITKTCSEAAGLTAPQ